MAQAPELPSLGEEQGTHPIADRTETQAGGLEQGRGAPLRMWPTPGEGGPASEVTLPPHLASRPPSRFLLLFPHAW